MLLGFGNGVYYRRDKKMYDRFSPGSLSDLHADGKANILELNCVTNEMLTQLLMDVKASPADRRIQYFAPFSQVSLHTPSQEYGNDEKTRFFFAQLSELHSIISFSSVIIHPDNIMDWAVLEPYMNLPFSVENMDITAGCFNTPDSFIKLLEKYPFTFTLDLAHCMTMDVSMKNALLFQEKFGSRLSEYHVSGTMPGVEKHWPLFKTRQTEIPGAVLFRDRPVIIESVFEHDGEHMQELTYIENYFNTSTEKI